VKAVLRYGFGLSATLAATLSVLFGAASIATGQTALGVKSPTAVSLSSPAQSITLTGASSINLSDSGCAGLAGANPNHIIQIPADSNLRFSLQGAVGSTLFILGDQGQKFCVQADQLSNGKVEIPGRWGRGAYRVFVGSRGQRQVEYKLTVSPT
jgi:hypothetical protein